MPHCSPTFLVAGLLVVGPWQARSSADERVASPSVAITRALSFLAAETPAWTVEHKCHSCHHNGDSARALYTAIRLKLPIPNDALADSTRWLKRPAEWEQDHGDEKFNDKKLARIQFTAAMVSAFQAGVLRPGPALHRAADLLVRDQAGQGGWPIKMQSAIAGPTTYGEQLATLVAVESLQEIDAREYRTAIARGKSFLRAAPVDNLMDAAVGLMTLQITRPTDRNVASRRRECLTLIRSGECAGGGWGPFVSSEAEPFDTALILLSLAPHRTQEELRPLVDRGRAFLTRTQLRDGSWTETTRPPGRISYAQQVSTTAWVTIALLETDDSIQITTESQRR